MAAGADVASEETFENLVLQLHEIEAVKFGDFKLKSGMQSPVYIDLRAIVSHPDILQQVAATMWERVKAAKFEVICGVPYTALPIATAISLQEGVPMLMRRKEVKDYGTRKAIEGAVKPGQTCLIVEDLVTSGASVMETVEPLQAVGLKVTDVVVLIDREQGAEARLAGNGLKLHSAFPLSFILQVLLKHKLIEQSLADKVTSFLAANQTGSGNEIPAIPTQAAPKAKRFTFQQRAKIAENAISRRLLELMVRKQSNLAVAADVPSAQQLLQLAEQVGPHISVLKTHVDIFTSWTPEIQHKLQNLAEKHDFLLFEDRKFADIGATVVEQYGGGLYRIADWAHITNAHLVPGPGIIQGLKQVGLPKQRGLLLLAEMSSQGALATGSYTEAVAKAAEDHLDFVTGFISQTPAQWSKPSSPGLIHMTPGVQLANGGDDLGQQYNTPQSVIGQAGSDVIIVGRGITKASSPAAAAAEYQKAGWVAYLDSVAA